MPDTQPKETGPFVQSLKAVPKSGLHNPLKNVERCAHSLGVMCKHSHAHVPHMDHASCTTLTEAVVPTRYLMYGLVSAKVAEEMRKPEVSKFFARLIQRVAPKSWDQAIAEVVVTRRFFENFSGDQVRGGKGGKGGRGGGGPGGGGQGAGGRGGGRGGGYVPIRGTILNEYHKYPAPAPPHVEWASQAGKQTGSHGPYAHPPAFTYPQVRFLARGFSVPGDHFGQTSSGHRWPYGPVCIIAPFNFPLEIPALQLMGSLYMGNKPLLHVDRRVGGDWYRVGGWGL